MNHSIREISRHSSIYRGFIITRRPKTIISKIARYEITLGEQSFGLFDVQALATEYIDNLYSNFVKTTHGPTVITPIHKITQKQRNEWVILNKT